VLDIAVQRTVDNPVQEVVLTRGSSEVPWGVSFETAEEDDGTPLGHYVKVVKAGGLADEAGVFEDALILTVNHESVRDIDHLSFIDLFKSVKTITLEIIAEAHAEFGHETIDVVISKSAGAPFGFVTYESDGFHFVGKVVAGSAAANKVFEYDEILRVNDTAVEGKTHEEFVALMQGSNIVSLTVHRHPLDPSVGVNKTVTDTVESSVRKDVEMAQSRVEMQQALERGMADFTKDASASAPAPAVAKKAEPAAEAPSSRDEMQSALERGMADFTKDAPAPVAPIPAATSEEIEALDAEEALPAPPLSPIPQAYTPSSPAVAMVETPETPPPAQPAAAGSALKAKIAARRAASGAGAEASDKTSTPLKDRIAARQAAAKTVEAGAGPGATLSPVEAVEPVDPARKASAEEKFLSTFGLEAAPEE
jgi:hypothetical protein